jgi:glycosyl hydrolase family 46
MRKAAFNITSAFEGGGYATYQNTDSGIISYGRFQFTLAAGNLTKIVTRYTQRSTNPVVSHLQAYLPRITAKDEGLRKDPELKAQLLEAANDPIMQGVQDEVAGDTFWQPVVDLSIAPRNIQSALGHALLFDMSIQHGLYNFLVPKAEEVLGLPSKSRLGENGTTEHTFIAKVAELRRDNLYALAAKYNAGGMKVRGDFWVTLVTTGDWDLQGDSDGNLNVKGKIRQVRNP